MTRISAFDAARTLAALHIVGFHHVMDYSPELHRMFFGLANMGFVVGELGFFFFCSAWFLSCKTEIGSFGDSIRFLKRRIVRIGPLYLAALWLLPFQVSPELRILSAFGINNFLPGIDGNNIPTLWFVSEIVLFYLLLPCILASRRRVVRLATCLTVEAAFFSGSVLWGWESRLWWYFPCYAAGVLLSSYGERTLVRAGFAATAVFAALQVLAEPETLPVAFALSGAGFTLAAGKVLSSVRRAVPFFSTIAYASMAAYLFHRPVYHAFRNAGFPPDGPARFAVLFGICMPVVFVLGWIIQKTYDRLVLTAGCRFP